MIIAFCCASFWRSFSFSTGGMSFMAFIPKNYARLEVGYREKALKLFPWV